MDGVLDVTGLVIGGDEIWVQTAVDQDCVTASVPVNEISLVTLVATAALTTKTLQSLFYNNGNNASTDNITAGVAA